MSKKQISAGVVHDMPKDLEKALSASSKILELWEACTPLGRNEFICWVEDAKKPETRAKRIRRTCEELQEGRKRPCCWIGCVHRTDKEVSPSVKYILSKKKS